MKTIVKTSVYVIDLKYNYLIYVHMSIANTLLFKDQFVCVLQS